MAQKDSGAAGAEEFKFRPLLLVGIALLSASAPFSIDMYLPALPDIVEQLDTTESMVQLTLSGFVVGLALGQLVIGPLSDAVGRKKLMVGGAVVALAAAVLAALAPSIELLILARVIQGLGSGACMVVSRAVIPDLAEGKNATRAFATMMSIQTLAPVIAPLVGGALVEPIGWRGLFWVLAGLAALQLAAALFVIPESRPVHLRTAVSVKGIFDNYRFVLRDAGYRGYLLTLVFTFATLFCYISGSAFLIQGQMGYSPQMYSVIFGINAVGLLIGNIINSRLLEKVDARSVMRVAAVIYVATAVGLLIVMAAGVDKHWPILLLLFINVSHQGLIQANAMSLGQLQVRSRAGSAAALMGFFQFAGAAVIGPLMGLGPDAGLTMAIGMAVCSVIAGSAAVYATARTKPSL